MGVKFKRRSIQAGVDMRNQCIFKQDFTIKELSFFVIRTSLVGCPNGRMFRLVMLFILINSKTVRPCHFCCFLGSLTRLFGVSFRAIVNTELTSNGNHFWSTWTSLHNPEGIRRCMLSQETCFGALSIPSFGHSSREGLNKEVEEIFRLVQNEILIA